MFISRCILPARGRKCEMHTFLMMTSFDIFPEVPGNCVAQIHVAITLSQSYRVAGNGVFVGRSLEAINLYHLVINGDVLGVCAQPQSRKRCLRVSFKTFPSLRTQSHQRVAARGAELRTPKLVIDQFTKKKRTLVAEVHGPQRNKRLLLGLHVKAPEGVRL